LEPFSTGANRRKIVGVIGVERDDAFDPDAAVRSPDQLALFHDADDLGAAERQRCIGDRLFVLSFMADTPLGTLSAQNRGLIERSLIGMAAL
jgi:hypothetical protein